MSELGVGDRVADHDLTAIDGSAVRVPDPGAVVHLQLRRFAGCPICHVHVHEIGRRHQEIRDAGIHEVVVFHSEADLLRQYQGDLPFDVIPDPEKKLYREFGVESSIRSVLSVKAGVASVRGVLKGASLKAGLLAKEDHFSQPADFLIGSDGVVLAAKYGKHASDQWSVDELLAEHAATGRGRSGAA